MSERVPEGWSKTYISDYFDLRVGETPGRNNDLYWDKGKKGTNRWVSIKDLTGKYISDTEESISNLGIENSNVKLLPAGTVMMSYALSKGRLGISQCPLYTNEAIVGFIEKQENTVDRDFLYYGLQTWNLLSESDQAAAGATLSKAKIAKILGLFPPLPEQKKIASILTSVDEVIENTQKQIDKLQDLKKATMNELLTKGIGHTEFKDSELGSNLGMGVRVPEGWSETYIGDFFDLRIGGTPVRNNDLYWDKERKGTNRWVSIKDLTGKYISDTKESITNPGVENSSVKLLPAGTVMMSYELSIGRLGISQCPLYTNEAIVGFIEKQENTVDRDFLYYGLQTWDLLSEADQGVTGAFLNKAKISRILGRFPPLPEQKKIASILTSVDEVIESTQKQVDKLQPLKKSLMQDLLTGKVRVKVD